MCITIRNAPKTYTPAVPRRGIGQPEIAVPRIQTQTPSVCPIPSACRYGGRSRSGPGRGTGKACRPPVGAQTPAPFTDDGRVSDRTLNLPAPNLQPRSRTASQAGSVFLRDVTILICPHKRNNAGDCVGRRMGGPLAFCKTRPGYLKVERLRRSIRKRRRGCGSPGATSAEGRSTDRGGSRDLRPYRSDWDLARFP